MKIKQALFTAGYSSFYFDDQQAIKNGAGHDGFFYTGEPVTQGFNAVRQAGECVSVQLILENGAVAVGDCAAVQYSGAGGRDPLFLAEHFIPFLNDHIKPLLVGRDVDAFLPNARFFDKLRIDGNLLHTADGTHLPLRGFTTIWPPHRPSCENGGRSHPGAGQHSSLRFVRN